MLAARATESRRCSGSVLSDASIGWGMEVVRDRGVGSEFGVVRYDGGVVAYRLVSGYGVALPDAGLMGVPGRMRVLAVVAGGEEEEFDAPSNVVFWPGEYRAVNCIPPCPPDVRSCGGGGGSGGCTVLVTGTGRVSLTSSECDGAHHRVIIGWISDNVRPESIGCTATVSGSNPRIQLFGCSVISGPTGWDTLTEFTATQQPGVQDANDSGDLSVSGRDLL